MVCRHTSFPYASLRATLLTAALQGPRFIGELPYFASLDPHLEDLMRLRRKLVCFAQVVPTNIAGSDPFAAWQLEGFARLVVLRIGTGDGDRPRLSRCRHIAMQG